METRKGAGRLYWHRAIDRVLKFDAKVFSGIQFSGSGDENLGKVSEDSPVSRFIRVRERTFRHTRSDAHTIAFRLNVPQTFATCKLSKRHAEILVDAGELLNLLTAPVAIGTPM